MAVELRPPSRGPDKEPGGNAVWYAFVVFLIVFGVLALRRFLWP